MTYPQIIQGGMGVGVSGWRLAKAVSKLGQLGVVSGTAIDAVLARRLQLGDACGSLRRAFDQFPFPEIAKRVLNRYFIPGGKPQDAPFKPVTLHSAQPPQHLIELTVLANFTEVFLAKENHNGIVGVNYLEKIQTPTLHSLYGAMLAGVDYVLMGAGIPRAIPGILDDLAKGNAVSLQLDVKDAPAHSEHLCHFDPATFSPGSALSLKRPAFLAIISSATLALTLAKKASGRVDGFVVEGSSAGGHNAPPRGPMQLNEKGEPVYGDRDLPDLERIKSLGLPFWLAGSYGHKDKFDEALKCGATGVQIGTAFAFCEESGIAPEIKQRVIQQAREGKIQVLTDPVASPTGFPFKVVQLDNSVANPAIYHARERVCDLGYLRHAYKKADGSLGYRCPGEPISAYVQKGGSAEDAEGRKCVCNGLMATIGLGQKHPGNNGVHTEPPLVTAGDDLTEICQYLQPDALHYTAADVVRSVLGNS